MFKNLNRIAAGRVQPQCARPTRADHRLRPQRLPTLHAGHIAARSRGIEHEIVSGDGVPAFRRRLRALTGGASVPQVVIDGRPIGGADRLARLDRRGVLAALAYREPLPAMRVRQRRLRRAASRWGAEAFDATGRRVASAASHDAQSARAALIRELRKGETARAA